MHIKQAIKQIFILCALALTMPTMAPCTIPTMPAFIQCLQLPNHANYAFNCLLIDITQIIQGLKLLCRYHTSYKKKNLYRAIHLIQKQLKEFETWLLQEEQDAMIAIKNKFNMNNEIWNACLADIQELKNVYKKTMQRTYPNISHDKNIPANLLDTLTTMLTDNSINPRSVSIKIIDHLDPVEPNKQMQVRSRVNATIDTTNNRLVIHQQYQPIIIEIFPGMVQCTQQKTTAMCAHEVQHIIQHHVLTQSILELYLQHYCSVDKVTLIASPECQQFIQIHEAQAELLSAIKDPEIAHCLSGFRANSYYPQYLYEEHYYHLSTVDMLWKLDAWLTWCQQFSVAQTKQNLITKMHNLADSFNALVTEFSSESAATLCSKN